MNQRPDVEALVEQLLAGATPEEGRALLDGLLSGQVSSIFEKLRTDQAPILRPVPIKVRGFRVRLDLRGSNFGFVLTCAGRSRPCGGGSTCLAT